MYLEVLVDCEQSLFVRENPTSDKKSRKYANEGKERGENKARHEKTDCGGFFVLQIPVSEKREILIGRVPVSQSVFLFPFSPRPRFSRLALRFDRERFYYPVAH